MDTVQDAGRTGFRHLGINPSGAMDKFAAQLCNALLGKTMNSPVIEMHFPAATILFQHATIACVTGANFYGTIDGRPIPLYQPFLISPNSQLQFERLVTGARCYLAVLHDLAVQDWLQSSSTNLKANAGGWQGRSLIKNDCIPFKAGLTIPPAAVSESFIILPWKVDPPKIDNAITCIKGNEWTWLDARSQDRFEKANFSISNLSDRMGYRLSGEALTRDRTDELISSPVDLGTVQLLPNGQLIILMADHQTTGGYPRVAHVGTASLCSLAQMKPNDKIHFQFISLQQAEDYVLSQRKYLDQLRDAATFKIKNLLHGAL